MTTRKYAAIAERLDRLADQMRETAIAIGGNRSVTPARPHIIGAARTARRCSLMLRGSMAESDRAMHVAAEIAGVAETLREWADTQPIGVWMRYGPTAWRLWLGSWRRMLRN